MSQLSRLWMLIAQDRPLQPPNARNHPILTSGLFWFVVVLALLVVVAGILWFRRARVRRARRADVRTPRPLVELQQPAARPPTASPPVPDEQWDLPPEERATG